MEASNDDAAMSIEEIHAMVIEIERPAIDPDRPPLYGKLQMILAERHAEIFRNAREENFPRVRQLINEHKRWHDRALVWSRGKWQQEQEFARRDVGVIPEKIANPPSGIAPGSYDYDAARSNLRHALGLDADPPTDLL